MTFVSFTILTYLQLQIVAIYMFILLSHNLIKTIAYIHMYNFPIESFTNLHRNYLQNRAALSIANSR